MSKAKAVDVIERCAGAQFHSPTPIVLHDVTLADGAVVQMCGTCRDNLGVYVEEQARAGWAMAWGRRREFGNIIRKLGDQGRTVGAHG